MYQAEYPPELWVTDSSLPQKVHLLEDAHVCISSDCKIPTSSAVVCGLQISISSGVGIGRSVSSM